MNERTGSSFDDFLEEEGILEEVSARAQKRIFALQVKDLMRSRRISKNKLATLLETSRSQLDRILDPDNTGISLDSLEKVAHAVGSELRISLA